MLIQSEALVALQACAVTCPSVITPTLHAMGPHTVDDASDMLYTALHTPQRLMII